MYVRDFDCSHFPALFNRPCKASTEHFESCEDTLRFWSICCGVSNTSMGLGCENSGKKLIRDASIKAFNFSLLLSPVVSFWDCIVRKMRYSFRPEWV